MSNESRNSRPLFDLLTDQIAELGELAIRDHDHEAFTLVVEELGLRQRSSATQERRRLRRCAGRSLILIPRLGDIFALSRRFVPDESGRRHVYVVLLTRSDGEIGFYVGQTGLEPAERFRRHLAGRRASRHVQRHGRQLLGRLTAQFCNMSDHDADTIEKELANALREAGLWVEGGH